MVCTAETYSPAPDVPGLALTELTGASTPGEVQTFLTCQRRGFDAHADAATEDEAEHFLRTIGEGRAFVAWLDGQPVGAGVVTAPFDRRGGGGRAGDARAVSAERDSDGADGAGRAESAGARGGSCVPHGGR